MKNLPRLLGSGLLLAGLFSAIVLHAQTAIEFNTLGAVARRAGKLDAAIADYTKAIALDPHYAVAYHNRASARRLNGDYPAALDDANKAIELQPDFPSAYNTRGNIKRALGDFAGASADFHRANALDPQHHAGAINLAAMARQKNMRAGFTFAGALRRQVELNREADSERIRDAALRLDASTGYYGR